MFMIMIIVSGRRAAVDRCRKHLCFARWARRAVASDCDLAPASRPSESQYRKSEGGEQTSVKLHTLTTYRAAQERGENTGQTVGYSVHLDHATSGARMTPSTPRKWHAMIEGAGVYDPPACLWGGEDVSVSADPL